VVLQARTNIQAVLSTASANEGLLAGKLRLPTTGKSVINFNIDKGSNFLSGFSGISETLIKPSGRRRARGALRTATNLELVINLGSNFWSTGAEW
jgi:hypothetical protein